MIRLLDKGAIRYRLEDLETFTGDPDFRALQSDPGESLLFRIGSGIVGISIDLLFFNGTTATAGTSDGYVMKKVLTTVNGRPFYISRSVSVSGLGPISARELVQEGDYYGIRLSNIVKGDADSLEVWVEGLTPESRS